MGRKALARRQRWTRAPFILGVEPMLLRALWRGLREQFGFDALCNGVRMFMYLFRNRLMSLGWKAFCKECHNGRWQLLATCCGHTIIAIADNRVEAWSAACPLAPRLAFSSCITSFQTGEDQ